jgi:hypothetical protein
VRIFRSSRSFIGSSFFFFISGTDVVFLTRLATSRPQPTTSEEGAAAAARRRHGLEVEDEGLLKDLIVIFSFLRVLYIVRYFFNARVLFAKKNK